VALFVFLLDFGTVPTVWYYWFFYWTLELFRHCGIISLSIGFWKCSDSVASLVFLLDLELFRQCSIIGFSIGLRNCSDNVVLFVFLLDFGTVLRQCGIIGFLLDFGSVPTV